VCSTEIHTCTDCKPNNATYSYDARTYALIIPPAESIGPGAEWTPMLSCYRHALRRKEHHHHQQQQQQQQQQFEQQQQSIAESSWR
jgi:hypothetical protein